MAKKAKETTPTYKHSLAVGQMCTFVGYSDGAGGQPDSFVPGESLTVVELVPDEESYILMNEANKKENLFYPGEFKEVADEEEVAEAAPVKAAKSKAKAKAAAPAAKAKAEATPALNTAKTKPAKTQKATKVAAVKAPKVKKEKKAKAVATPVVIPDTEAVDAILAESGDAITAADNLGKRIEETYFTMGGVLAHIYRDGLHKTIGFTSKSGFRDYVEQKLDMNYRNAMYMIAIYTHYAAIGTDEEILSRIGWTKARELIPITTAENVQGMVAWATDKTRDDIILHVKETVLAAKGKQTEGKTATRVSAEPTVTRTKFTFTAFEDQSALVKTALAKAKEASGSDNENDAFLHVFTEWALLTDGVAVSLEDAVSHIERKYDVALGLIEEEGPEDEAQEEAAA